VYFTISRKRVQDWGFVSVHGAGQDHKSVGHATNETNMLDIAALNGVQQLAGIKIRLVDTKGIDKDNYKGSFVKALVRGVVMDREVSDNYK
jgi:hypothetical protein